ncbi:transmembrane protein 53 [Sitophilus oryzae]|uniref:Transmembrane protein 53 n=1 Tax=Sitophilus oryzae TaxID=7048 RepID=A0A6J2Y927_SITOR|nr:transmembrane protein 53 [Sitophilus oryzae]
MANPDGLEYHIKFPNPNFNYNQNNAESDFVFVVNEEKLPVIVLFGWAGCKDRYLAKYSQIYEERGLITLRYTAPIKLLFTKRHLMAVIGEKLVKLLFDLNFETHPIFIHCFSNGGAFLYQNFSIALDKQVKPLQIKGVIFDSAPGKRRVMSLFRAISAILEGNIIYNFSVSFIMTMFLSVVWLYEIVRNQFSPRLNVHSHNPFENLQKEKNRCPQLFIYSKNDDLIPHTDIEHFAKVRRDMDVDVSTVCYETSLHVKHLPENRESYVTSVFQFINKCLNGIK